jgi:NAD(P)H-dependent flavin oxidoreductase YrpB (nitropropane dioxygenase family)
MHTQLCDLFGIDVPIFAFSHCRDVVAAVTNAGGLGVLGALAFSPEQLEVELLWIDENVDGKPYGVDTVMPMKYEGKDRGLGQADEKSGEVDAKVFQDLVPEPVTSWIESVLEEYEVPPLPEGFEHDAGVGGGGTGLLGWTEGGGRNHVDIALQHPGVKLLVNALGPPPKDIIDLAHDHGIKVAALTGAVEHAIRQQQQGVDIIVAQGTEAGGHTGEIGSMVLLPDIVDAVSPTPVLGAGGIASGRQAAAAMALGAQGIWTGSVWLGVRESDASPLVKEKLFHARPKDAVRSRSLSGKPARLLRTAWTDAWERDDCPGTLPMPLQYMACAEAQTRIMFAARKQGAKARELVGMPVGQVVGRMTEEKATAEVMYEFIDEFVQTVDRLQGMLDAAQKL